MPRGGKRAGAGRPKKEIGRPTEYRPEKAEQARKLCELGATDFELASFFEVSVMTIHRWRNTFPEFCEAVKAGKAHLDDRVERSLYQRAVGYSFESEKVFQFQGQIVRAKTVEHVPPDPGAAMNWLKNRRSDTWRDKSEVLHKHDTSSMSDDELLRIASGSGEGTAAPTKGPGKPH
ncbi:MAG: helix-turn-helix domain-containing protein [Hyphomicrobiales bacterium]|nr:helix-turn-helix domain-containing protein [Hyphomicrobiales bacterium]MBV8664365.1 helix-turn-helix domain-containing protein [Hyphomicrobiales bacterium]